MDAVISAIIARTKMLQRYDEVVWFLSLRAGTKSRCRYPVR